MSLLNDNSIKYFERPEEDLLYSKINDIDTEGKGN